MKARRGTLLLIEDDTELSASLKVQLSKAGFRVVVADSVVGGLVAARKSSPAVVVANVDLPFGQDIVTRLWRTGVPLVLLTRAARGGPPVPGVEVVVKPFLFYTLLGALATLTDPVRPLEVGAVRVSVPEREVTVSGTPVRVSRKQFEFLMVLMRSPHRAYSVGELKRFIWPDKKVRASTVAKLAMAVRWKLAGAGQPTFIRTVRGFGYGLSP